MPREKEMYRENLRLLSEAFPNRATIRQIEAARYLGIDVELLAKEKTFPRLKVGGRYFVPIAKLASWMS